MKVLVDMVYFFNECDWFGCCRVPLALVVSLVLMELVVQR